MKHMEAAFAEAVAAKGKTLPNPPVGAVLVKNGRVVGRGGTRPAGQAHAEIVALEQARGAAAGATLFVTLEPCRHFGKTPPCTRALIEAGIARVVAACPDPNPKMAGKGFAELRRAGIAVETGILQDRAEEFYGGFFFWIRNGRPRIVVKIAQSLDGRINARPGAETRLTGAEAQRFAHVLRTRADAILVGGHTLRTDNPELTPRLAAGAAPEIAVLTRDRKPDPHLHVFARNRAASTVVISPDPPKNLSSRVDLSRLPGKRALVRELLDFFSTRGYHEVLVEGGRGVWTPFLNAGLCDVLHVVTAPVFLPRGEGWATDLQPGWVKPLEFHRFAPLGHDVWAEFRRRSSASARR